MVHQIHIELVKSPEHAPPKQRILGRLERREIVPVLHVPLETRPSCMVVKESRGA